MSRKGGDMGRTISQTIYVRMVPKKKGGNPDAPEAVAAIGRGLVIEAMKVLTAAAEAEGFEVTVELGQVLG